MATKKFTKNAQRVFNKNPYVLKCTQSKITFTDEFIEKVKDLINDGTEISNIVAIVVTETTSNL